MTAMTAGSRVTEVYGCKCLHAPSPVPSKREVPGRGRCLQVGGLDKGGFTVLSSETVPVPCIVSKGPIHDSSIKIIPKIIAHCAIHIVQAYFNTSFIVRAPMHQSDVPIFTHCIDIQ